MKKIIFVGGLFFLAVSALSAALAPTVGAKVDLNDAKASSCGGTSGSTVQGKLDNSKTSANQKKTLQKQLDKGTIKASDCVGGSGLTNIFVKIANILLFFVGVAAVIVLIIGGLRYATSGGEAQALSSAKNTILYAIVGIIVAFLAFAAVNFVAGQLK